MARFVEIVLGFPTAIFTTLLLISVGWWLLSLAFGLGESDTDIDGGSEGSESGLAGMLRSVDLHLLPLSLVISILSLTGWMIASLSTYFLTDAGGSLSVLVGLGVILAALIGGVFVAGRLGRLLSPIFVPPVPTRHRDLIGRLCTVRTGRVDESFGQAEVLDREGSSHIVQVRCGVENDLTIGIQALIVDVNHDGLFVVSPDIDALT